MSTSSSHHFLLIGLPETGKTSFLAALWYMVDQSAIDCALRLHKLKGERKYLNEIRDAWLQYRSVPRNRAESDVAVSMSLERRDTGAILELSFPDLAGESFRLQWAAREFTTEYDDHLSNSKGGVLFIHPENIEKPIQIQTVNALAAVLDDEVGTATQEDGQESAVLKPFDIEAVPTQVKLVELLQFIASRDYFSPPFRLAVAVSAWDLLSDPSCTPRQWLQTRMPLLSQFLECNLESFEVSCYGVSAQGGKYASPLFTPAHFREAVALAQRILNGKDAFSAWLKEHMGVSILAEIEAAMGAPAQLAQLLARSFNHIITTAEIYQYDRFKDIKLRHETRDLLNSVTQVGEESARLNRLLLEDAYPAELSKEWINGAEARALQGKAPERRVTIVMPDGKESHDITEPLLWLMH